MRRSIAFAAIAVSAAALVPASPAGADGSCDYNPGPGLYWVANYATDFVGGPDEVKALRADRDGDNIICRLVGASKERLRDDF